MPLVRVVYLCPGDIVLDGDPAPSNGAQPQFLAYVSCAQTAGWIKMPLDMEVGLGPVHIVLDVNIPQGSQCPMTIFCPSVVAKRLDGSRCHMVLFCSVP